MNTVAFKNQVAPTRRNLKFQLDKNTVDHWNPAGVAYTQFMNTLSIFFPAGERFFIDSVRHYRDKITDPQLKEDVKAFIGQEAMHTREHLVYNQALIDAGFPVDKYMDRVEKLLDFAKKTAPPSAQLAVTIALEHLTASLGDVLLREPDLMEGADSNFKNIWLWHAMEEVEHKGVAYDVWNDVMPKDAKSYTIRVSHHLLAHLVFWSLVIPFHIDLVNRSQKTKKGAGWLNCMKFLWGKPGALRQIVPDMLDYFRRDFHPWQQDNRELLDNLDEFALSVTEEYQSQLSNG